MSEMPYCMAHLMGTRRCGCALCKRSRKIRRENNLLVWGCVLGFLLVVGLGVFKARSAECHSPGNCSGGCVLGTGCGTGPGCACVPSLPGSPLGTCVGG